jgi:hypothetical protein
MTSSIMTCEAFDAALPDYLEETLDEGARAAVRKHLSECVRCASLVRDLEKIRKDAAALPDLVPSRDLWQGIEGRISAPVISIASRPERQRRLVPVWMGIAAAALIVSTAGITYMLTARSLRDDGQTRVATAVQQNTVPDTQRAEQTSEANAPASPVGGAESSATPRNAGSRAVASTATQSPRGTSFVSAGPQKVYDREIEMLQNIVKDRKSQLDSATVAIIERNLQIIDAAIAQSKAALVKDPASRMLGEQLTHALDKKVELLRTAAMLPAST